jgi:hypothetical protein
MAPGAAGVGVRGANPPCVGVGTRAAACGVADGGVGASGAPKVNDGAGPVTLVEEGVGVGIDAGGGAGVCVAVAAGVGGRDGTSPRTTDIGETGVATSRDGGGESDAAPSGSATNAAGALTVGAAGGVGADAAGAGAGAGTDRRLSTGVAGRSGA